MTSEHHAGIISSKKEEQVCSDFPVGYSGNWHVKVKEDGLGYGNK
ncbi:hypothetical protein [Nafulsella turpanensis]|nr:hypothetical protein [Nafulsella turpanensis]